MEVHSHTHTASGGTRKKWTHYFWEFLMLFLAVFCGFLAENQREHYIENLRAKELIIPLLEDIREDTSALNTLIELRERQTKVLDTIRNIMRGEDWKQGSRKLYSLFRIYIRRQEFQNRNTTIDQLKNSGYLRYYKDQKLVSLIQQYIIDMQLVKDRQSRELQVMDNSIDPINSKFFDQSAFELPISEQDIIIPESSFMIRNLNEFRKDDFINQLIFLNGIRRINNSRVYNRKALESANKLLDRIALDFPGEVKKVFSKN
jgi:hypothetical protein